MKKLLVIILIFVVPSICSAEQWDTADKYLLAGLIAVQTLDWLQTNYIFKHDEYYETNPIITKKAIVPLYFITLTLLKSLVAYKMDSKKRKIWLSFCILHSTTFVIDNMVLGIGFSF